MWVSSSTYFLFSILLCCKGKSFSHCWISELYLAVRLWISVLTVSENELFRFCLSLLSLCLRTSAFLLPPSLPFLSAAFSSLLSFNVLSLFLSLCVLTSVFHFFRTLSHLALVFFSSPHFPSPPCLASIPLLLAPLSTLVEPFVLPSSVT